MSKQYIGAAARRLSLVGIAALTLAACDENGEFALPVPPQSTAIAPPVAANTPNQSPTQRDVERPDVFAVTDRGLWDGRPSLGGVWVAHPDVQEPERVIIRNAANGSEITGALFRRERENPGPLLQISSDAADALGVLAGAPTELSVVAVRREEVEVVVPDVQDNPVVDSLSAPVSVAAVQLEPVEAPAEPADATPERVAVVATTLPAAVEAATAAIEQTTLAATGAAVDVAEASEDIIDVSSILDPVTPPANGPRAQIGVFSVEANANLAVTQINGAGIAAQVRPETMGGRTVWRVVAGPMMDESGISQLKALGFVDAFVVTDTE